MKTTEDPTTNPTAIPIASVASNPSENPTEHLTLKRAAEMRGLNQTTLWQWCYDGKIPTTRKGTGQKAAYLVKLEDLDRYLADPRGAQTALSVQAGGGQGRRPLKAEAERRAAEAADSVVASTPAAEPSTPAKRKRKTAVRMSKDFMRKCTVPEMLMISTWLLHRVETRLKDGCVPRPTTAPVDTPVAAPAAK